MQYLSTENKLKRGSTTNDLGKRPFYTLKEILKHYYPEIWDKSDRCIRDLEKWQNMVLELFPLYHKQVLDNNGNRASKEAQVCLLNYIKLRSLYKFVQFLWEQINCQCHELASYANEQSIQERDETEKALCDMLEYCGRIPIEGIVEDEVTGFFRLYLSIEEFKPSMDILQVLVRIAEDGSHSQFSYRDITGTIHNCGLQYDGLWETAVQGPAPTEPSVGGLMDAEEDNKTVRYK